MHHGLASSLSPNSPLLHSTSLNTRKEDHSITNLKTCPNMDHFRSPVPLSTKPASATFPPTHGSTRPNETSEPLQPDDQASRHEIGGTETRHGSSHRSLADWHLDGGKSHHHRHKQSKSRELRLPRPMSHLASSASARGLLPTWSGSRDKDREEDGLLRPMTRETTRSRWGSDSTSGLGSGSRSRQGSILEPPEQQGQLGPIRRQEIQSMEDLGQVTKRRKQGEQ